MPGSIEWILASLGIIAYTTYQAVQIFCLKLKKVVVDTHKHLP